MSVRIVRLGQIVLGTAAIGMTLRVLHERPLTAVASESTARWTLATVAALGLVAAAAAAQRASEGAFVGLLGALWLTPELEGARGAAGWLVTSASAVPMVLLALVLLTMLCRTGVGRFVLVVGVVAAAAAAAVRLFMVDPYTGLWCWRSCAPNPWALVDTGRPVEAVLVAIAIVTGAVIAARRLVVVGDVLVNAAVLMLLLGIGTPIAAQTIVSNRPDSVLAQSALVVALVGAGLLSGGLVWPWLRTRLTAARLNNLAGRLTASPASDQLARSIGRAVGDAELRVEYWDPQRAEFVDADGRAVAGATGRPGARYTAVAREGALIARIEHAAHVDSGDLERALGAALRLVLENGRLRATALAELDAARQARTEFVKRATAERRMLERNLHDGAQQRVVALLLLARMLNDRAAGGPAQQAATRATSILGELLAELRRIARGIYPAVVADSGLAAALEDLADTSLDVVVDVRCESLGQFDDSVATTAYLVCAAALADARSGEATQMDISATRTDGLLAIAVEDDSRTDHEVTVGRLVDRVVALSGSLSCSGDPTGYRLLLELPCAS